MKRVLAIGTVAGILLLGLVAVSAAQKGANFAGTWKLDKAKSELPEMMQGIESMTWTITQTDQEITRAQKVEGGGGGGGGRGMGGAQPVTLKLDGSETTTETPRGKTTYTAKWLDGGKMLEINSVANINVQGNEFKITSKEHWELAEDGKVLKAHVSRETPRGAMESKMVFTKE